MTINDNTLWMVQHLTNSTDVWLHVYAYELFDISRQIIELELPKQDYSCLILLQNTH